MTKLIFIFLTIAFALALGYRTVKGHKRQLAIEQEMQLEKDQIEQSNHQEVTIDEIEKMTLTSETEEPAAESLEHGLSVVIGEALPKDKAALQKHIINKLNDKNIDFFERDNLLVLLLPEVGKSPDDDKVIFNASIAALSPMMEQNINHDSADLRGLIHNSIKLMVATNKDSTLAAQEVAWILEKVTDPDVSQLVVESFSKSYGPDGEIIIRQELTRRGLFVRDNMNIKSSDSNSL